MDPQPLKISMQARIFFLNLRRHLLQRGATISGLFTNILFLKHPQKISQVEFMKILMMSESKFNVMQTSELFNQLKNGDAINVNSFTQAYEQVDKAYSLKDQVNHQEKAKPIAEKQLEETNKELEKKMIRIGLTKLQDYVAKSDAVALFKECDVNSQGFLTRSEFNKFLVATDIKELNDHTIRHVLIKKIFEYYKNGQMSLHDFMKLFKIKERAPEPQRKQLSPPHVKPQNVQPQPAFRPTRANTDAVASDRHRNPIFKKDAPPPVYEPVAVPSHKKQDLNTSTESNQMDMMSIHKIFPKAYALYRLGVPDSNELQYFEALEAYLDANKVYHDKDNPISHIGKYESASKFFKGKYHIFQMASSVLNREKSRIGLARQIEPKDIMQGQVGDCYLLSSIASVISFYPEVVSGMFLFSPNDAHFYAVRLFIDGQWRIIATDDQFPCEYGKPVFAKPHGNQIWVMLLEKCFAKVYGSYKAIDSGTPTEGFRVLTGAPAEYISTETPEQINKIYGRLEEVYAKRYVATASGSKLLCGMNEAQQEKLGLIGDHAYSFLKFLKINDETVVKMRNPWGKTVWKGEWSFESKKWTPSLREKYNYHTASNDGTFYIPWPEFTKYFSNFVICRLDPTFLHTSLKITVNPHKSTYVRMLVKQEGTYCISVTQKGKRHAMPQNYDYSPVRFVVVKENHGQFEYVLSVNKTKNHFCFNEKHLTPGMYFIAVKMLWEQQSPYPVVLTSYGSERVQFQRVDNSIAEHFKQGMIKSYSRTHPGKVKTYAKIKIPEAISQSYFSIEDGIGYFKVKNPTHKTFKTTLEIKGQGLKMIKLEPQPNKFTMTANTEKVIGFWVSSKGYSYESSESMEVSGW